MLQPLTPKPCFPPLEQLYLHDLVSNLQPSDFSRASLRHSCDVNALKKEATQVKPCGQWIGPLPTEPRNPSIPVPTFLTTTFSWHGLCHDSQGASVAAPGMFQPADAHLLLLQAVSACLLLIPPYHLGLSKKKQSALSTQAQEEKFATSGF